MRIARAIDAFLDWGRVERDWTPRTLDSYRRILDVLVAELGSEYPIDKLSGRAGTDTLRTILAKHWGKTSAGTRANRISALHSFFAWAEEHTLVGDDPARRLRRPPRRRADIYRPPAIDVELCLRACTVHEHAPWIVMARRGFRASTVCALRWSDLDLQNGLARVQVKGGHRDWVPLGPQATRELRDVYRLLEPDHDDHVFTVEVEWEHGSRGRRRIRRDPKQPASTKSLWLMVRRVCGRAGVTLFGPHALRHSFATSFLRTDPLRSQRDLQGLMGHSSIATTELYLDDLRRDELEDALRRGTSVADEDDEAEEDTSEGLYAASGPGRSRTSGPSGPTEEAGGDRADDDPRPPLTDRKRGHK